MCFAEVITTKRGVLCKNKHMLWFYAKQAPTCDVICYFFLLGKAKEVDMEFTRANDVVRMLVQCTNVAMIPDGTDLSYDGTGYGIYFEVEGGKPKPKGDISMSDANGYDDDIPPEDKASGDFPKDSVDQTKLRSAKRDEPKANNSSSGSGQHVQHTQLEQSVQVGSFLITNSDAKLVLAKKKLWGDRVDDEEDSLPSPLAKSAPPRIIRAPVSPAAAESLLVFSAAAEMKAATAAGLVHDGEVSPAESLTVLSAAAEMKAAAAAESVHAGEDVPAGLPTVATMPVNKPAVPLSSSEGHLSPKNLCASFDESLATPRASNSASPCRPSSGSPSHASWASPRQEAIFGVHVTTSVLPCSPGGGAHRSLSPASTHGTGVFLGGRYSQEQLQAFGGIPVEGVSDIRSSERIRAQPNASDTQLERAMKVAEKHDIGLFEGNNHASRYTIASFDNDLISKRAAMLGVSLGSTSAEVGALIKLIKDLDLNRTMIMLKNNLDKKLNEGDESSLVLDKANSLSSDLLLEEEQQGSEDHKDPTPPKSKTLRVYRRRRLVAPVRYSERLKNKKA
jgi:hypothetical protein